MGFNSKTPVHPLPKPQEQEQLNASNQDQEFTCQICTHPIFKYFNNGNICSHPICTNCIIDYTRFAIQSQATGRIPCPAFNCSHQLDPHACASSIGPSLYVRWCDVLVQAAVLKSDKCYCPNVNCNELILNECGGNPMKSKCPNCKNLFCFKCKRNWHYHGGCDEQEEGDDEVAVRRLAENEKWKRCPVCKYFVEHRGGCLLISCRCGIRFCYVCGEELTRYGSCACPFSRLFPASMSRNNQCVSILIILCLFWVSFFLWIYLFRRHLFF